jgi:hypothetical protein
MLPLSAETFPSPAHLILETAGDRSCSFASAKIVK